MDPIPLGIVFGIGLAAVSVAMMVPMQWESRRRQMEAIAAAATDRFMIGLLIPNTDLDLPRWLTGVVIGVALSIPDAITTKAYPQILGLGLAGGLLLGVLAELMLE